MRTLTISLDEQTARRLERFAERTGKTAEELAAAAVSAEALRAEMKIPTLTDDAHTRSGASQP